MEQKIRRDRNMGDNLRRLRIDKGISQEKLCAELQRRGCDIGRTVRSMISLKVLMFLKNKNLWYSTRIPQVF